ncbi:MAG: signal recognition particle-docking protein FtsY [Acidimicrobiales bacterium]
MLLTLIVVACAAFVVLAGFGGYAVVSHRRERRALPGGRRSAPPALRPAPERPPARPGPARRGPSGKPAAPGPVTPEAPPADLPEEDGGAVGTLAPVPVPPAEPEVLEKPRFRDRLGKARSLLASQLAGLRGRSKLDQEAWDELEEALVLADVGILTTESLLQGLKQRARAEGLSEPEHVVSALRQELVARLEGDRQLRRAGPDLTTVWLFVGVNGVGKTTTIGKVAMRETEEGRRVVVAAGDTFRAAAADQLQIWAERVGAGFVRGSEGGDPGAVVFDAVQHAAARGVPLVLADTAGRLHTKVNLMEELKKVRRVADRPPGSVTEVLLVIDATTGQNGLVQARQFTEAVGVTGIVLTKLDGTAKGGIAVAITSELGVPIKLVGLGEGPEDLVAFDAQEFVDALLPND